MGRDERFEEGPPREVVCPYCFEVFSPWDMLFKDKQGQLHPARRSIGQRIIGGLRHTAPEAVRLPGGEVAKTKVCPNPDCQHDLPHTAGTQRELMVGLIGASASGKSQYVGSLIPVLQQVVSIDFNCMPLPIDDATEDRYNTEFKRRVAEKSEVDKTPPYAPPLLYDWAFDDDGDDASEPLRKVTLSLFDRAGEIYSRQDEETYRRYLKHAVGVLFILDPTHIPDVRESLPESTKMPRLDEITDPATTLAWVVQQLVTEGRVGSDGKITTPIAVTLSKCDLLRDAHLLDPNSQWSSQHALHQGQYNLTLHDDVNGMFRTLIRRWSPQAAMTVETRFSTAAYFGVTATGCASDERGIYARIAPWRTQDPVLWLLYTLGIIPGRRV